MHRQVTNMVRSMAASQQEMARILEAERQIAVHMARMIHEIPAQNPGFEGVEELKEHSLAVTKNNAMYLGSLAELVDSLAEHLTVIVKLVEIPEDEE